jgi:chaperonin GroEL (HSP60 family)
MIVRRCFKTNTVVAGGGATEMELSRGLKQHAVGIAGKEQLVMNMFAKSLEVIPRIIADNAGLDSLDIINKLRTVHCNSIVMQSTTTRRATRTRSTSGSISSTAPETTSIPSSGSRSS